jgi:flagellar hook-associated protein 3 FlgL
MTVSFRTTQNVTASRVLDNLQLSMQRMQDIQSQLSSGRIIQKASDDPSGAIKAMTLRSQDSRTQQYSRNAQDGIGWLSTADTTMTSALDSLQRVRTLVLQASNGTSDANSRAAIAAEIKTAKQTLIGLANTTYQDHPIFAGTADPAGQTPPVDTYDQAGNYNGNTGAIMRTIGPNASVQVNLDGPSVWGQPGINDMWHMLDDIQAHLTSPNAVDQTKLTTGYTDPVNGAMKSDLDRLDAARLNIQNQLSSVGARQHRTEAMQSQADDNSVTIQNNLTTIENIDIAKTIVALNLQNTAYQAALSATAKVIQPSLVDFLK